MITNFIQLDFNKENDLKVPSVQYDSGSRFVKIKLQQNKVPFEINGYRVTVVANKVDGTEIMNDCTILDGANGLVEFEITEQFNAVEGVVDCQLKLFKGKTLLTSMPFSINVVKSVSTKEIVSSNELKTLVNALGKVQDIDNRFAQTNAQLLQNKNELSDKIQEVASTGTTTEVLQSTTENYIQQKIDDGTIAHLLIEDGGVTPEKTSFIGAGLNLFDKNSLKDGYLHHGNGEFVSELDSNLMVSSFIPVKNGDILYYSDVTSNYTNTMNRIFEYDQTKRFIKYTDTPYNSIEYVVENDGFIRYVISKNVVADDNSKVAISLNIPMNSNNYEGYRQTLSKDIHVEMATKSLTSDLANKSLTSDLANKSLQADVADVSKYSNYAEVSDSTRLLEKVRVTNLFDVENAHRNGARYTKQEDGSYLFSNVSEEYIFWFIYNIQTLFDVNDYYYGILSGRITSGDYSNIGVYMTRLEDEHGTQFITIDENGYFKGFIFGQITSNTNPDKFGSFTIEHIPTDGSVTIELYNFCYIQSKEELATEEIEWFYTNRIDFNQVKSFSYTSKEVVEDVCNKTIPTYLENIPTKNEVNEMIDNKLSDIRTWYHGKKLSIFGDSVTECSGSFTLDNGVEGSEWSILVQNHFGFREVANCGMGGTTVCNLGENSMSHDNRINAIPLDSDVITFMGGINDWLQWQPVGAFDIQDGYYYALMTVAEKLTTRFPTAKIFWMTPTYGLTLENGELMEINPGTRINLYEYVKAMREVAKRYGFPLIDLYGECGWNRFNAHIYLNNEGSMLHPNKNGGKRMASVIIGEFEKHEPIN